MYKTVKRMRDEAVLQAADQQRNYDALAGPLARRAQGLELLASLIDETTEEAYETLRAVAVLLYENVLYPLQTHLTDNEFFTNHRRRTGRRGNDDRTGGNRDRPRYCAAVRERRGTHGG